MKQYVVLLRGINVGGKNKVPMAELSACLEGIGYEDVRTYIASGNVLLRAPGTIAEVREQVEQALPRCFDLDVDLVRVLVLSPAKLRGIVEQRPAGFGDEPDTYHCDCIFLLDITAAQAMEAFDPREGVDRVWPGRGVVYSQRLSAERTKSRLSKVAASRHYRSMTIRNWRTTTRLAAMLDE